MPDGGLVRTFTDMTDYVGTLEALRQSEARWRSLTHLSSDWYWEQDEQLRFVRLDGRSSNQVGIQDDSFYGRTRWELDNTFVDDKLWREHRAQLQAHEVFHNFEIQRRKPSGEWMWVSVSGEPIFDKQGQFAGTGASGATSRRKSGPKPRSSAWRSTTSSPACPTGAC